MWDYRPTDERLSFVRTRASDGGQERAVVDVWVTDPRMQNPAEGDKAAIVSIEVLSAILSECGFTLE